MPSIDQPGHGACVVTAAEKWTWDEVLLNFINSAHEHLVFPTLVKTYDARVTIIVATHSHTFVTGFYDHDEFKKILNLEEESKHSDELSRFYE